MKLFHMGLTPFTDTECNPYLVRGFTLLELLVSISIAAILMTVGVPSFNSFIRDSDLTQQQWTLS